MKKKYILLVIISIIIYGFYSCEIETPEIPVGTGNDLIIDIDGNVYAIVRIGDQVWMAENLKVTHFNNGDPIQCEENRENWLSLNIPGYCYYNNLYENRDIYGALYNWPAVKSGMLCPAGWHIPSLEEWEELIEQVGGPEIGGENLKSINYWDDFPGINPTNESGFTGVPGGHREWPGGSYQARGFMGRWWSSSIDESFEDYDKVYRFALWCDNKEAFIDCFGALPFGNSVRCIKD